MPDLDAIAARHGVAPGRVMLTNGSLQGFALLAEMLFAGSGGRAVVEGAQTEAPVMIDVRGASYDDIAPVATRYPPRTEIPI